MSPSGMPSIALLGEQITARGIGNGISLIILSGIVAELPSAIAGTLELGRQGALSTGLIFVVIVMVKPSGPEVPSDSVSPPEL